MSWRLLFTSLMACCGIPRLAEAHAPPLATDISWFTTEGGEQALIRTNRGLIIEEPGGGPFRIVCNDAFEASLAEVPPVAVSPDGRLLIGTYTAGLVLSSADRCDFDAVAGPFSGLFPIDVEAAGEGGLYAAVLPYDGGSAELLQTVDQGRTAEALATLPGAPSALELAPSDSSRLYVSSTVAEENLSFGRLLASRDAGRSFSESAVELEPSELRVYLLAVDPKDPDRLFLRTQSRDGLTPERLLRSGDGGSTFDTVLSAPGPLAAVVEPGGVVWAGGADGLYRSDDGGESFTPLTGIDVSRVTCLSVREDRLYVCGYSAGEFGVLVSADAGASFQWFLRFPWVTARLECPAMSDEGRLCAVPFLDWIEEQGLEPTAAGGAGGAGGAPDERTSDPPAASERGCQVCRPGRASSGLALLMGGAALAVACRRRRRAVSA